MPYLVFNLNDGNEFIFDLVEDRLSLGRDAGNEIVIDNSYISSFHAKLVRQADDSYEVSDLKSANGTFINGERIERGIFKMGDRIRFGQLDARLLESKKISPSNESKSNGVEPPAIPEDNGDLRDRMQERVAIESQLTKLQAEFKELELRHASMMKEVTDMEVRGATQSKQHADIEESIKKLQECEETANQKLAELELRQSELQSATESENALLESLTAKRDALQNSIAQLTSEESALRESIITQTENAKELEQKLAPSREALQQTELALADARAALDNLSQIHADDAAARSSLQEAVSRREEEENRAAQLAAQTAEMHKLLTDARAQHDLLQTEQSTQESLRQNLAGQIADQQARHETAAAASEAMELKLAELQAREDVMSTGLEELTRRVDDLRREEDGLSASLHAGRERLQKIEATYEELEKKLAAKELAYAQFTHSGDRLVSLSEALSQMESREQEVSRHLTEVAEQELSTQVKLNCLDEEIMKEQHRLDQIRHEREHEEEQHRLRMEKAAGELDAVQQYLTDQLKQREPTLALRVKERIQELEEKHETLRLNLSANLDENTVIVFANDLIKRIDLVDILIQRFPGAGGNSALEQQLRTLRASLEDILAQHGIREFSVAIGTEVDVSLRLLITIVENISGTKRPKVVESYRPGFIYAAENGREVILRKVEVKTSSA